MDRTIILHYHLFKNAGTSLDAILKQNFGDKWATREFPSAGGNNTSLVEDWIRETPEAIAYSSHSMMGPIPQVEGVKVISIMLLRDPIERIKSAYRFERKQAAETFGAVLARHTDMEGYMKVRLSLPHDRQCRNFQTQRLATLVPGPEPELARAVSALGRLSVVGLVSDFSGTLKRLATAITNPFPDFSWKEVHSNRSRKEDVDVPDALEALLAEPNADDLALLAALETHLAKMASKCSDEP
ncbi:MAG: sulfotransferase family protein [Rhodobacteraceae bacterium]|nr:sulfotransferase family protein [Paracoccaceae bacterium]